MAASIKIGRYRFEITISIVIAILVGAILLASQ